MRLSTINQIVESILDRYGNSDKAKLIANEATIYLKTAYVCENEGIEKAMEYFFGTHDAEEYVEFMSFALDPTKLDK